MKSACGPWMVLLLAGLCGACGRTPPVRDTGQVPDTLPGDTASKYRANALPAGCALPTKPDSLKACVADTYFDDLELAGDEQPLSDCHTGTCIPGPLATIQPEKSSHLYREEDLRTGRIIARMFLNPHQIKAYGKLGMSPGDTTYWWVQKAVGATTGTSYYLTVTAGKLVAKRFTLHYEGYKGAPFKQALARWLWDPKDEKTQGTCGAGTCR